MGDAKPPKVFLDTSALFAGIWPPAGGGRAILKLGEARAIQLLCGSRVLSELEEAFREKAPQSLSILALLIDASNIEVASNAPPAIRKEASRLIKYSPDAEVFAAAIFVGAEYFVTLDRRHFLSNTKLKTEAHITIGTPGDFFVWFKTVKLT